MLTNKQVTEQFHALASLTDKNYDDNTSKFRAAAYRKAALKLEKCTTALSNLTAKQIQAIGFGKSSAAKIYEVLHSATATIGKLVALRNTSRRVNYHTAAIDELSTRQRLTPLRAILRGNRASARAFIRDNTVVVYVVAPNSARLIGMLHGTSIIDGERTRGAYSYITGTMLKQRIYIVVRITA